MFFFFLGQIHLQVLEKLPPRRKQDSSYFTQSIERRQLRNEPEKKCWGFEQSASWTSRAFSAYNFGQADPSLGQTTNCVRTCRWAIFILPVFGRKNNLLPVSHVFLRKVGLSRSILAHVNLKIKYRSLTLLNKITWNFAHYLHKITLKLRET